MKCDEIMSADCATLNRLAATEVMGWRFDYNYCDAGAFWIGSKGLLLQRPSKWHPATDHNDAATCRSKIEELGLLTAFALELAAIVFECRIWLQEGTAERSFTNMQVGDLLNATPEQTTRACLLAMCKE